MYFADIASSPFYCGWNWRTGWARTSIAGTENEGKIEIGISARRDKPRQNSPDEGTASEAAERKAEFSAACLPAFHTTGEFSSARDVRQ
jgi:hypothetical protein